MSCEGCVDAVERAITGDDDQAQVQVDLATKLVAVQSVRSGDELKRILAHAGFPALIEDR